MQLATEVQRRRGAARGTAAIATGAKAARRGKHGTAAAQFQPQRQLQAQAQVAQALVQVLQWMQTRTHAEELVWGSYRDISCIPSRVMTTAKQSMRPLSRAPGTSSPRKRSMKLAASSVSRICHIHLLNAVQKPKN